MQFENELGKIIGELSIRVINKDKNDENNSFLEDDEKDVIYPDDSFIDENEEVEDVNFPDDNVF